MNSLTKKLLIFALVMTALGAAGWFGRKAYKSATERRLVAQSNQYLEKKDARNAVLCQITADVLGRRVLAGPVEATALGNVLVQARARGLIQGDLAPA